MLPAAPALPVLSARADTLHCPDTAFGQVRWDGMLFQALQPPTGTEYRPS